VWVLGATLCNSRKMNQIVVGIAKRFKRKGRELEIKKERIRFIDEKRMRISRL
jgi:hypothetical protein